MIQEVIKTSKENRRKILKNLLLHADMLKCKNIEFGKGVKTILMWLYEKDDIVHNPFSEINSFH